MTPTISCPECQTWGNTITREQNPSAVACPACGRLTWPNLGVNCPAGSAVSFGAGLSPASLASLSRRTRPKLTRGIVDVIITPEQVDEYTTIGREWAAIIESER